MVFLRAVDHKRMPWKNGGGETVEIAVSPQGAGLADFDWRISMATVALDGPFSVFPGIDRTLSILKGDGMQLSIDGRGAQMLTGASDPLSFPADVSVSATLPDGPITDLNVMTRRGSFDHRVRRIAVEATVALVPDGAINLVLAADDGLALGVDGQSHSMAWGDAAQLSAGKMVSISGQGICYLIAIDPAHPDAAD